MGNAFEIFVVSMVISRGEFHCADRGCAQNIDVPGVKPYFPRSKGVVELQVLEGKRKHAPLPPSPPPPPPFSAKTCQKLFNERTEQCDLALQSY